LIWIAIYSGESRHPDTKKKIPAFFFAAIEKAGGFETRPYMSKLCRRDEI